jgi:hypothetical protein
MIYAYGEFWMNVLLVLHCQAYGNFFSILIFFNYYSRNEPVKYIFSNLNFLSHVNPSDTIYEGVAPVHLVRLKGLTRERPPRWPGWCHIVSVAPVRSARLVLKSRQFIRRDPIPWIHLPSFSFFLLTFFLSAFSLHLAAALLLILTSPLKSYPNFKPTSWVGISIILGTYVVFTVSFPCILKISFEWTHVVGIED